MTDFNVQDLLGNLAENPWTGMHVALTQMLEAGFTEDQAMRLLTGMVQAMVAAQA